jgi:superfamily II DNA or RNA helicase
VRPLVLLGLTATPERADSLDVLRHFEGRMSAQIRLPDAINRKLLCPFQYFGVTDVVDLQGPTTATRQRLFFAASRAVADQPDDVSD